METALLERDCAQRYVQDNRCRYAQRPLTLLGQVQRNGRQRVTRELKNEAAA